MRVVGGKCKGRRLTSFKGLSIRPTSDKVREAVFNILPRGLPYKKTLDLFAGTGAMGIEALSRGLAEAVFVDKDSSAASVIHKNLEVCGLEAQARVYKKDIIGALRELSKRGEAFGLIFIDPPYGTGLLEAALKELDSLRLLEEGGCIVAETSKRAPLTEAFKNIKVIDERRYGDTVVYFLGANPLGPEGS